MTKVYMDKKTPSWWLHLIFYSVAHLCLANRDRDNNAFITQKKTTSTHDLSVCGLECLKTYPEFTVQSPNGLCVESPLTSVCVLLSMPECRTPPPPKLATIARYAPRDAMGAQYSADMHQHTTGLTIFNVLAICVVLFTFYGGSKYLVDGLLFSAVINICVLTLL